MNKSEIHKMLKVHNSWQLSKGKDGKRAFLSGADLREVNLNRYILSAANLSNTNLNKSDLSNAQLIAADLSYADLRDANLSNADLRGANLRGANLRDANLSNADLRDANLMGANLSGANLTIAILKNTELGSANFTKADLTDADLSYANLTKTNLSKTFLAFTLFYRPTIQKTNIKSAKLLKTKFIDVELLEFENLGSCEHLSESCVDTNILLNSGHKLPKVFLRGIGFPDNFIKYFPSLSESAIQYYSCFISYSHKDELFAKRLHNDLQNEGIRCWFAPEDFNIGDQVSDNIYKAIRIKDKLLVIMSKKSVNSDWVEEEVEKALAKEKSQNKLILFPVRIDDEVMKTSKAWAEIIRNNRHIGDFRKWEESKEYKKAFNRLLRDLKVSQGNNI